MRGFLRIFALLMVFAVASVGWIVLGGIMSTRSSDQTASLYGRVADLWGAEHRQQAPTVVFRWDTQERAKVPLKDDKERVILDTTGAPIYPIETISHQRDKTLERSDVDVTLQLDQRRKGLMWYSLYDVEFAGAWRYTHNKSTPGVAWIQFTFPQSDGSYDDFHLIVDGKDQTDHTPISSGSVSFPVPVVDGQTVDFEISYRSRGMDAWSYWPTSGTGQVRDFSLDMKTDFASIDFPANTMSPSTKERAGDGWELGWRFERLVTGNGIGMQTPSRIQPGPLAAQMSFFAPVSLGLFMAWVYVLSVLKKIDIHPINYLLIAGAFFAFHLLFGYSVDHLPVEWAFVLSSVVSVVLVTSYLRLVVGTRFALVEAGGAQILYLVGFSLAHFWEGFTGLTITVLSILTLFALMQLTGRIRWSDVLADKK